MFCPKCGKKNDDNSLFCTWCGAGFGSVSTQSLSAAPAASAPVEAPATHQELQTVSAAPIVSAENSQAAQSAGEIKQPEPIEQPAYSVPTPGVIPQSSAEHTAAQTSASGALNSAWKSPCGKPVRHFQSWCSRISARIMSGASWIFRSAPRMTKPLRSTVACIATESTKTNTKTETIPSAAHSSG